MAYHFRRMKDHARFEAPQRDFTLTGPRSFEKRLDNFLALVRSEALRARKLFPGSEGLHAAFAEESGEVANALLDHVWPMVAAECIQTGAMAARLAIEGDPLLDPLRARRAMKYGAEFSALIADGHETVQGKAKK
jgi:hypothetical protein